MLPSLCCCGEGSASSLSPSLCRGVRKSRPAAGPSSCPLVPGRMRHASPRPIDSRSWISLRTVAVTCLRSRAPLSFLHLLPLAVERSRRWLVTRCVDRVAAALIVLWVVAVGSFRRRLVGHLRSRASSIWSFLWSAAPRRPSSVAGIVDLVVPSLCASRGPVCLPCPACGGCCSRYPPLVEAEWMSLPLSPPTPVLRCLVLPAESGLYGGGTVRAFSSPTLLCCPHSSLVSGFTCSTGKFTILPSRSYVMCSCSSR